MKQVIDIHGTIAAMERVSNTKGIRVRISQEHTQPCIDLVSKTMYLPPLGAFMARGDLLRWKGYGYHEVGHVSPELSDTLPFMQDNEIDMDSLLGMLMNIGEDIRNERTENGIYAGRDEALDHVQAYHCIEGSKKIKEQGWNTIPEDKQIFAKALGLAYEFRGQEFQPLVGTVYHMFESEVDYSDLKYLKPRMHFDTIQSVYDWAIEILKSNGKSEEEARQEAKEAHEQQGEEGDGKGGQSAKGKRGKAKKGKVQKGEEGLAVSRTVSYKDLLAHDHRETEEDKTRADLDIDYDHDPSYDYRPSGPMLVEKAREGDCYLDEIQEQYNNTRYLSGAAKRLFQSASQKAKLGSQEQGKLDRRALHKVPTGSREVFYKETTRIDPRSTAVSLLVDCSGSMSGTRFVTAAAAATVLCDSLVPLQMPVKVAAFTDTYKNTVHYIMKDWQDRADVNKLMRRFTHPFEGGTMSGNDDGASIMYAVKDLLSREEQRKILIVLSDGQPAGGEGDAYTYAKGVIDYVQHHVECYGIGIESDAVSRLYKDFTVLQDPAELDKCLLQVIKRKILV